MNTAVGRPRARRAAGDYPIGMGDPRETIEAEVTSTGDVPDEESLAGRGLEQAAPPADDEPAVVSVEAVTNGSQVGWSD